MFRIGGSAEGLTSGLDYPKPNASRPRFFNGNTVVDPIEERFLKRRDLLRKYQSPRSSGMRDFLIGFGLDIASRPPQGSIFSTAAAAAKDPFSRYAARKEAYKTADDKLNAALLGDVMELASEEERAKIKAKGEIGKGKQFEYKGKMEDYQRLIEQQRELEKQLQEEESIQSIEGVPGPIGPQIDQDKIDAINKKLEDNAKLQELFADKEEDQVRAAILKGISNGIFTFEDLIVYDKTGVPPKQSEFAEGGRAGYQNAGAVMPGAMQTAAMQGPKQDSPVQNLSYEELRSRLPASITDDIVQLIANSQEALVDFANIQTQRDVKSFNQKYQVELVLPQEA
jgi:hypothetical protein|tara:strand:- start:581 stop:1600 length:1020 start_codon:yes stop_codon:yes gene_type:complete